MRKYITASELRKMGRQYREIKAESYTVVTDNGIAVVTDFRIEFI